MKRNARTEKSDVRIFRPLNPEECSLITGGTGLLAFPFIQQALQGSISANAASGQEPSNG
jgi:hypothetical protein